MKKKLSLFLVVILCLSSIFGCGMEAAMGDAVDQVANVVQSEDENVLMVKNASNVNYPDVTYGEAFDDFFGSPTWKYFKGELEGPDDDGDGKPDYTNDNIDVVEFTGYCTYADAEVKALIQFALDKDTEMFVATYLSFNNVPQSTFILTGLISSVFESYENKDNKTTD